MAITAGKVIKYAILPGIFARLITLFTSGFSTTAYFIACIYRGVRLLPADHPYTQSANIGKYSIRKVIAAAANNLVLKRQNIDQIIVFTAILIAIVILLTQFILLILALLAYQPALAQSTLTAGDLFTRTPEQGHQDIAMILMDRIFGITGIFNSCISIASQTCTDINGYPTYSLVGFPRPFHTAFHAMLEFYSYGMFLISVFIILYFITAIVAETASTGVPLAQRFNKTWFPVRIVLFFALLLPIGTDSNAGINAAQFITFRIAKGGSNFASNAWERFNEDLADESRAGTSKLIAKPNIPELDQIVQFIYLAKVCKITEETLRDEDSFGPEGIQSYLIRKEAFIEEIKSLFDFTLFSDGSDDSGLGSGGSDGSGFDLGSGSGSGSDSGSDSGFGFDFTPIDPDDGAIDFPSLDDTPTLDFPSLEPEKTGRLVSAGSNAIPFAGSTNTSFADALEHTDGGTITIRFGSYITDKDHQNYEAHAAHTANTYPTCGDITFNVQSIGDASEPTPGYKIQEIFYNIVQGLWTNDNINKYAECFVHRNIDSVQGLDKDCSEIPDSDFMSKEIQEVRSDISAKIKVEMDKAVDDKDPWNVSEILKAKGWAGAGIWYNRIAELNGSITSSILNIPTPVKYPFVMEYVALKKKEEESNPSSGTIFEPIVKGNKQIDFNNPKDEEAAPILYNAFAMWNLDGNYNGQASGGDDFFSKTINLIFGTSGIYDIRNNPDVNPLAQLSAIGRGMMDASIRNIGLGTAGSASSKYMKNIFGDLAGMAGKFFKSVGFTVFSISFTLYYILPLTPFIFFFFAVGGWVKSIFEATIAMPLWAMAHITNWGGQGLPGETAVNGYMLLLEIFLRPILIVFGLLASISIFSAMVMVLNEIFTLAINNIGGFNDQAPGAIGGYTEVLRAPVDQLMYTVVYTFLCYMIGMSSFKLIDALPNQILRWMNFQVETFQENSKNAAETLSQKTQSGVNIAANKLGGQSLDATQLI